MTSRPSQQPSIADAARLMDSLSFASQTHSARPAHPVGAPKASLQHCRDAHMYEAAQIHASPFDDRGPAQTMSSKGVASESHTGTFSNHSGGDRDAARVASLPAEIVFHIASQLVSTSQGAFHGSTDIRPATFPCKHAFPPYAALCPTSSDLHALLSLSSTTRQFRNTLVPLIWHTIVIRTPQHLPRLAALLKSYDTLSIRSTSPQRRRSCSHTSQPDPAGVGLRHPLPHIRSIVVSIPDKYMDLDQSYLLTLLRSMHLSATHQLQHLSWSAEAAPNPAIWPLLAPSLRSLELDGRTFYQGHEGMAGLERLESLTMVGYESTLLPAGVVAVFQAQAKRGGGSEPVMSELPQGLEEEEEEERRNRASGESPVMELQAATRSQHRRRERHLYLDPPRSTFPPSPPSPSPPSPAPPPPSPHRPPLTHLSLSTSKTSLFHQPTLALSGLTHLEIYPVTPQPPLAHHLIATACTLTHLRIVLDISGAFANFDALWRDLTGKLPELQWLHVDPMPQQNTAPSFAQFVQEAQKLEWINGRRAGGFPPCFGDPANSSGALPF